MTIANLTLKQAQEKMAADQKVLAEIFDAAFVKTDSGDDVLDHTKVAKLLPNVKSSADLRDEVKQLNAGLDELGEHIETLLDIQTMAKANDARGKAFGRLPLPGAGGDGYPANKGQFKSLGERVLETAEFKAWHGSGAGGGVGLNFEDVLGSEFLAKAAAFDTIGNKTLMTTAAGFAPQNIRLPGFVEAVTRPIQLLDILPLFQTGGDAVPYMEETTRTHAAAETAQGGTYAESTFAFTEKSVPVVKITDSLPVTDEQLEDVALIESYVNGRLGFGVRQRLDQQAYNGNGTGANMRGILNTSGIQTQAKATDPAMDAFYKAMTKVRVTGRAMPTHHIIHPTDWQNIRLTRTADGIYIFGNPSEAGPERLWGLPVVQNEAASAGTALVGSFQPAFIALFERRGVVIQVGFTGTQFTEGKRTVRADMRAALQVARPAAFATVTGL